jgi:hypothetical protein
VFVLADEAEAVTFAGFMSREVDPAHVMRSSSPLAEALSAAEHHHEIEENRRAMVLGEEVPF